MQFNRLRLSSIPGVEQPESPWLDRFKEAKSHCSEQILNIEAYRLKIHSIQGERSGEEEGTGIAGIGLFDSTIDAALKVGSLLL
jgi:hypothetical protein